MGTRISFSSDDESLLFHIAGTGIWVSWDQKLVRSLWLKRWQLKRPKSTVYGWES